MANSYQRLEEWDKALQIYDRHLEEEQVMDYDFGKSYNDSRHTRRVLKRTTNGVRIQCVCEDAIIVLVSLLVPNVTIVCPRDDHQRFHGCSSLFPVLY
jgi:hypothetical protein